jgi:argininosuccinate lyase
MNKLWETASVALDPRAEAFMSSLAVDRALLTDDIEGSIAHAAMLGNRGILPADRSTALVAALRNMLAEAAAGTLTVDEGAEDVHSFVEAELTSRLGDAGKSVHAGRSRNDQVAVDLRLYLRKAYHRAEAGILAAMAAIIDLAEEHLHTLMPAYTHMRRAQPITLAFHLAAWCAALERDAGRFGDARRRADECPLGCGAVAGSGLPLDRAATAAALGFARPSRNAMDATADRDVCVDYAAAAATLLMHLSRYCEEIILWTGAEYGFADLAHNCSTGSSIMPQKRNPDVAELIRGKSGAAFGALMALLTMQKGVPLGYARDMQEDKAILFDLVRTVDGCLEAFAILVGAVIPKPERMRAALDEGFVEATDLAELLVIKGVPFRDAYGATKHAIAAASAAGKRLHALNAVELAAASPAFAAAGLDPAALADWLDPAACVARRSHVGGPAPETVRAELARLRALTKAAG